MNPFKKLAGETAIYGLSSIVGRTLNFLLFPMYVHIFPPEEYGIITNLHAYVAFFLIFLTYGMETTFFRFSKKYPNSNDVYSTSASSVLSTSLLFLLIIGAFLKPLTSSLGYPGQEKYVLYLAIIVAIDAFTAIPFAYLRKENKALRFATIKVINIGIQIGLNLLFFLVFRPLSANYPDSFFSFLYNPAIGICYVFTSNLVANVVTLFLLYPEIRKIKFKIDFSLLKPMLKYALPILIVGFAGQINQNIDKILLKFLVAPEQNPMHQIGVYGANYKIAILMSLFIQAFSYSFEPFFFSQDDSKKTRQTYADIMKYFIILGWIIFLGITLYIDIFKFLESPAYYEGLKIVPIILIANLLMGVYYNQAIWYKVTDKTKYGAYQSVVGALVTLGINLAFIPVIGYMASAIASLLCVVVMVILSYIWGRKYYPIDYDLKRIFIYTVFALAIYLVSVLIPYPSITIKIIANTILFAIFVGIVFLKEIKPLLNKRKLN